MLRRLAVTLTLEELETETDLEKITHRINSITSSNPPKEAATRKADTDTFSEDGVHIYKLRSVKHQDTAGELVQLW